MKRKLGKNEAWHWISNAWSPLNIVVAVEIQKTINIEVLTNAAISLSSIYPFLRSRLIQKNGAPCFEIEEECKPIIRIATLTSTDAFQHLIEQELNQSFNHEKMPSWRILLGNYEGDSRGVLLVVASHIIVDGASINYLTTHLLALCGIGNAAGYPSTPQIMTDEIEALLPKEQSGFTGLIRAFWNQTESIIHDKVTRSFRLLPRTNVPYKQRSTRICSRSISRDYSSSINLIAQKHDVSLEALVGSALICSLLNDDAVKKEKSFRLGTSVSLRMQLPKAFQNNLGSCVVQICTIVKAPDQSSLLLLAKSIFTKKKKQISIGEPWMGLRIMHHIGPSNPKQSEKFVKLMEKNGPAHVSINDLSIYGVNSLLRKEVEISSRTYVSLSVSGYFVCIINESNSGYELTFGYIKDAISDHDAKRIADNCVQHLQALVENNSQQM